MAAAKGGAVIIIKTVEQLQKEINEARPEKVNRLLFAISLGELATHSRSHFIA